MSADEQDLADDDLEEVRNPRKPPPTPKDRPKGGPTDPNMKSTGQLQSEVRRPTFGWIALSLGALLMIVGMYAAVMVYPSTTHESAEERLARVTQPRTPPEPIFEEAAADDLALPAGEGDDTPSAEEFNPEEEAAIAATEAAIAAEESAAETASEPIASAPSEEPEDPPPAEEVAVAAPAAPCTGPQDTEAARIACLDHMIALARSLRRPP